VVKEAISVESVGANLAAAKIVIKRVLVFRKTVDGILINFLNNGGKVGIEQNRIAVEMSGDSTKTTTLTGEIPVEKEVNRANESVKIIGTLHHAIRDNKSRSGKPCLFFTCTFTYSS
jgi:cell division ATPase FtsA